MNTERLFRTTALYTVLFALFLNYMGIGLVFSLFPQLCFDTTLGFLPLHATHIERSVILGILLALMPLTQFFFSPLLGIYSDSMGRKPLLVRSLSIGFLGYFLGAWAIIHASLSMLLVSRVLVGISTSNSSVIAASLADLSPKEKRAQYFSLYCMSVGCGLAVGPLLGALLSQKGLSWTSYSLPFLAAGTMTLLNLVSIFFCFPKYDQKIDTLQKYISPIRLVIHSFFEKKMRLYFAMAFVFYFGWTFFWEFVSVTLMHTMSYKSEEIGFLYAVGATSYTLSALFITRKLLSKMAIHTLMPFSLLATSFLIGSFALIHTTTPLFISIIFIQFFLSMIFPLLTSYVSQNAKDTEQGKAIGMLLAVKAAACSLGPLCSGFLFSLSAWTPVVIGSCCLMIAGVLSFYYFSSSRKETNYLEPSSD